MNFTPQELEEYAKHIGIDVTFETDLMWISEVGLRTALPEPWLPCELEGQGVFYFNQDLGTSTWDHPCDEGFRAMVEAKREESVVLPVTLHAVPALGEALTVEAWSLSGERVATAWVARPRAERFGELRERLLKQLSPPEGTALRLLHGSTLLRRDSDGQAVSEIFFCETHLAPVSQEPQPSKTRVAKVPVLPRECKPYVHRQRHLKRRPPD